MDIKQLKEVMKNPEIHKKIQDMVLEFFMKKSNQYKYTE